MSAFDIWALLCLGHILGVGLSCLIRDDVEWSEFVLGPLFYGVACFMMGVYHE